MGIAQRGKALSRAQPNVGRMDIRRIEKLLNHWLKNALIAGLSSSAYLAVGLDPNNERMKPGVYLAKMHRKDATTNIAIALIYLARRAKRQGQDRHAIFQQFLRIF